MPALILQSHEQPQGAAAVAALKAKRARSRKHDLVHRLLAASASMLHDRRAASTSTSAAASTSTSADASTSTSTHPPPDALRTAMPPELCTPAPLVWDWDLEHADRAAEARADAAVHGAPRFEVDRRLLRDIVREKAAEDVVRINFLGAGTFHKGYLVTLASGRAVVARVARRFLPRLKTASEVATIAYLRACTPVPVPDVLHWDANPYNRLGGEWMVLSKARGVPLAQVFHSMSHAELAALMESVARLIIPLFAHRFPRIGSLYLGPDPDGAADIVAAAAGASSDVSSAAPTPTVASYLPQFLMTPRAEAPKTDDHHHPHHHHHQQQQFHVGPIVSWPFFGSNRGELPRGELDRGPWATTGAYLRACAAREVQGVVRENEGRAAPHRLHLDPGEIAASRHHHVAALPGDESDASDEWSPQESEEEWEGPGASMYRDYRRMQRSTFLVSHLKEREARCRAEMARVVRMMERLGACHQGEGAGAAGAEEFALDCHDLSLENVFVDEKDHSKITCIIDWEATTTRPLWACAHVPTFLQSSPFTAKMFRATVERLAHPPAGAPPSAVALPGGRSAELAAVAREWLHHEAAGARLRMAHRCLEWDGWEEGLVPSILGPEEDEEDWFAAWDEGAEPHTPADGEHAHARAQEDGAGAGRGHMRTMSKKVAEEEKAREKLLNATGDVCGGRGGELGRRLEAWLVVCGDADGRVGLERRWEGEEEEAR